MMQLQEPLPRTAYAALQLLKATLGAAAFKTSPQDRTGTRTLPNKKAIRSDSVLLHLQSR